MTKAKSLKLACGIALVVAIASALPCCFAQPAAREVHVLAAADLQPVLPSLADAFEHATGIKLVVSYGSSATLATQIVNGEAADLFLAADFSFPEKVVAAGLADSGMPIAYARGTLVLWARKDSPLQPLTQNTLLEGKFTSLAIANPEHAPYGRASVEALNRFKIYAAVQPKLVIAENIGQTAQFVESGNAQLGMISLTAASTERFKQEGSYILIPPSTYFPLQQCAVVMKKSEHGADAHAFLDWLRSAPIQKNLKQYGLEPAE
jgi:molybdate transport system substrate-binding protein